MAALKAIARLTAERCTAGQASGPAVTRSRVDESAPVGWHRKSAAALEIGALITLPLPARPAEIRRAFLRRARRDRHTFRSRSSQEDDHAARLKCRIS